MKDVIERRFNEIQRLAAMLSFHPIGQFVSKSKPLFLFKTLNLAKQQRQDVERCRMTDLDQ